MRYILDHTYHPLTDHINPVGGGFHRCAIHKGSEITLLDINVFNDEQMVSAINSQGEEVKFLAKTYDIKIENHTKLL